MELSRLASAEPIVAVVRGEHLIRFDDDRVATLRGGRPADLPQPGEGGLPLSCSRTCRWSSCCDERHDDLARALQAQPRADVDRPARRPPRSGRRGLARGRRRPGRACRAAAPARPCAGSRCRRRGRSGARRGRARRSASEVAAVGARQVADPDARRERVLEPVLLDHAEHGAHEPVGAPAPPRAVGDPLAHRVPGEPVRPLRGQLHAAPQRAVPPHARPARSGGRRSPAPDARAAGAAPGSGARAPPGRRARSSARRRRGVGPHPHCARQSGLRFSANARTPS